MIPIAPTPLSLTVSRVIRAPRPRVFAAFASVEEMKKWFGPGQCHVIDGEMDFRTGGRYRFDMHTTEYGRAELSGAYEEIVPGRRIRFTWRWGMNAALEPWGEMRVVIEMADAADGTRIVIRHEGLMAAEVRDGHEAGWNGSLDKLSGCLAAAPSEGGV